MKIKKTVAALITLAALLTMTACGAKTAPSIQNTTIAKAEEITGSVALAGSTSMQKLCEAMMESFQEAYPGITVTAEYTGSGAGLEALIGGKTDIGNASRALKDGEKNSGAVENIVAIDGIAVITHRENTIGALTGAQLVDIYTGKYTNWKELGGKDEAIVVIGREAGSGTRGAFEELLKIEDQCRYAQELDSTGGVLAKVAATPGAIGYVSLDVVDGTVAAIALDGVAPTEENIVAGTYTLARPFVMATKGSIETQSEAVQTWFRYVASEEGRAVITGLGLILPQ